MATKARDTAPPGKEKRGKSPSHPIPQQLRSPNSSKTNSPVRKHANSTTSNKHVPNYLKPTISSSNDHSIHKKPTLTRGGSFNKPPVAAALPKNTRERILRTSSSFSGKTSSISQKHVLAKDSAGKQHGASLDARAMTTKKVTTTSNTSKKHDSSISQDNTHKPGNGQDASDGSPQTAQDVIPLAEPDQDDTHKSRSDQDDQNESAPKGSMLTISQQAVADVMSQAELSKKEDNQELTVSETETNVIIDNDSPKEDQEELNVNANNTDPKDLKVTESSIVMQNQEVIKMEEPAEEKLLFEETSHKEPEENPLVEEIGTSSHIEPEEIPNKEQSEPHLEQNPIKEEENKITVAPSKPQCQVVQGKKESVVSNDVIEETASKLREQRKNRVKALAGAFETVISLQEPKT